MGRISCQRNHRDCQEDEPRATPNRRQDLDLNRRGLSANHPFLINRTHHEVIRAWGQPSVIDRSLIGWRAPVSIYAVELVLILEFVVAMKVQTDIFNEQIVIGRTEPKRWAVCCSGIGHREFRSCDLKSGPDSELARFRCSA